MTELPDGKLYVARDWATGSGAEINFAAFRPRGSVVEVGFWTVAEAVLLYLGLAAAPS